MVAALLNNQRGQFCGPDQPPVFKKILCQQLSGSGRVRPGSIQAEGDDQIVRLEAFDLLQRNRQCPVVAFNGNGLRQRIVDIKAQALDRTFFIGKSGKMGIGKTGVTVY